MEIAAIHKEFHHLLRNYVAKRVSNRADVEDLVQEIFMKIHDKSPADDERMKSWLFAITRNAIIDYYRKNKNRKLVLEEDLSDLTEEADFDRTKELERCLHRFIDELPEEYRQIILDSEIRGIRQKDLAGKYSLAYPSVRSRVQRGRAKLKEMFMQCCSIELDKRGNVLRAVPRDKKC